MFILLKIINKFMEGTGFTSIKIIEKVEKNWISVSGKKPIEK